MSRFKVLSFDCYGTLIDWEAGILSNIRPWLNNRGVTVEDSELLKAFGPAEASEQTATPRALYPEILQRVHARLAAQWGLEPDPAAAEGFGASIGDWPPFPDSHQALTRLKDRYRLVILSNVDRDSFAGSRRRLGIEFDAVYTAEDIGSYKPDPRNFSYLIEAERHAGYAKEEILHVAQSLYHDHVPAKAAGLTTCWIQRPSPGGDHGATRPPDTRPEFDYHFGSLADLAEAALGD